MTSTERMLYDDEPAGTPGAPAQAIDTTPEPKVEDFDAAAFIAGIRPYREATLIHSHGDLVARARELGTRITRMDDTDPTLNAAIDEFEALQREFRDGGVWWEVEARSVDWVISARATSARKHGITVPNMEDLDEGLDYAERMTILFDQIAGQVVTPSGVTADMLRQLDSVAPGEARKLVVATAFVNNRSAQEADVFGVDFSSRRSGNRRARRSSARSK